MPLRLVLMTAPEAPTSRSMAVPLGNKPVIESEKGPSKSWLKNPLGPLLYKMITTLALLELDIASKYHLGVFSWSHIEFQGACLPFKRGLVSSPSQLGAIQVRVHAGSKLCRHRSRGEVFGDTRGLMGMRANEHRTYCK